MKLNRIPTAHISRTLTPTFEEEGLSLYSRLAEQNHLGKSLQRLSPNSNIPPLRQIKVSVVSDIQTCRYIWELFSPNESLSDLWDYRYAFWQAYQYEPYFLTFSFENEILATLPLWYSAREHIYMWFGSEWQGDNQFFTKDTSLIPFLLAVCPAPTRLSFLKADSINNSGKALGLENDYNNYILRINSFEKLDDFLYSLSKKRRYNLRRDQRLIESRKPKLAINQFGDFDELVRLSTKRLQQKDDGYMIDWVEEPACIEAFKNVIQMGRSKQSKFQVKMISARIDGKVAGVDLIAIYRDRYYPLACGYDVRNFSGIGNYFNLMEIEEAIEMRCSMMDFLSMDYGWKDQWLETVPQMRFVKKLE